MTLVACALTMASEPAASLCGLQALSRSSPRFVFGVAVTFFLIIGIPSETSTARELREKVSFVDRGHSQLALELNTMPEEPSLHAKARELQLFNLFAIFGGGGSDDDSSPPPPTFSSAFSSCGECDTVESAFFQQCFSGSSNCCGALSGAGAGRISGCSCASRVACNVDAFGGVAAFQRCGYSLPSCG